MVIIIRLDVLMHKTRQITRYGYNGVQKGRGNIDSSIVSALRIANDIRKSIP